MKNERKTKIIATLGPSSSSMMEICSLIEAGMDIARINLSHGDRASHLEMVKDIRLAREKLERPTAILLDTRGPEIRVGVLAEPIILIEGRKLIIKGSVEKCSSGLISVSHRAIASEVSRGDRILLDDGKMALQVIGIEDDNVVTRVVVGGVLTSRKRVSLPGVEIGLPSVSEEDREDILFGIEQEVDFIAASFIRRKEDVFAIREIIESAGGDLDVIAKIENRQGVDNMQSILEVSDGLMVARGDLGVDIAAEEVPVIQKQLISAANGSGKPVITATQMLESMISSPFPTRAEASDVSNAVMDGSDCVMLSGETAMGKYPLEAVNFLARCTEITESATDYRANLSTGLAKFRHGVADAIAYGSCAIAADLAAAGILCITTSGSTARKVAMYRPQSPIIAASPNEKVVRRLQLVRGVTAIHCEPGTNMDQQINSGIKSALQKDKIKRDDMVVITGGLPLQKPGVTNILRVHTIGVEKDALSRETCQTLVYT